MRWIHIDNILELKEGEYARAVKRVPADTDYLNAHYPGFPLMPHSLLIESMAQTAGILIGQGLKFEKDVILAKIDRAEFHAIVRPGDNLTVTARLEEAREEGARAACAIHRGDEEVARAVLVFAVLSDQAAAGIGKKNFVFSGSLIELLNLGISS
jgi:3-hydroxyacyl-[acyl-carrier-protein] dehydratase